MPITLNGDTGIVSPAIDVTTPITVSDGGTGLTSAGTLGNVLTSDGTNWVSQAISAGGNYIMQTYTSPATWTKPSNLKSIKVTVVGTGGGSVGGPNFTTGGSGGGGTAIEYIPASSIPGPVAVTCGPAVAGTGPTSSFGAFLSATGGVAGTSSPAGGATGSGGSGSGGNLNMTGATGTPNSGGMSFMGTGGVGTNVNGNAYGGGSASRSPGGNLLGGVGVVIVEEFY